MLTPDAKTPPQGRLQGGARTNQEVRTPDAPHATRSALARMSGNVVAWVFRRFPVTNELDRNRKLVLSEIAEAANRDFENSHPGVATICASWGFGRSTVIAHLGWLVENGWLEVTERGRGRGHATVYRVCREKVRLPDTSTEEERSNSQAGKGPDEPAEKVQMAGCPPYVSSVSSSPSNSPATDCSECNGIGWVAGPTHGDLSKRCVCNPEAKWRTA